MKATRILALGVLLTVLNACHHYHRHPVVIQHAPGKGHHCPPGQAKKGNC